MRLLTPVSPFGWQWETPLADAYVGTCLHVSGAHSLEELAGLAALVPPDGKVLDGGANLGALTIPLARGGATVVAVEPQAQILDCLTATAVRARVLSRVVPVFGAITGGDAARMPQVSLDAPLNFGGIGLADDDRAPAVPTFTIDQLAAEHGPFDLVKLDLEGREPQALAGAAATLAAKRAVWCVEIDRDENIAAIVAAFEGYTLHRWSPALEAPHAHIVSHNLLAVPVGRDVTLPMGATPWG